MVNPPIAINDRLTGFRKLSIRVILWSLVAYTCLHVIGLVLVPFGIPYLLVTLLAFDVVLGITLLGSIPIVTPIIILILIIGAGVNFGIQSAKGDH
jgi:hypothetical protein